MCQSCELSLSEDESLGDGLCCELSLSEDESLGDGLCSSSEELL